MSTKSSVTACILLAGLAFQAIPALTQLRGHGGPVRALAISEDGGAALSGSFDTSAILWDLRRGVADQVLRVQDGAVNAVAFLKDGRAVTAGADKRIAVWTSGRTAPDNVLAGHAGSIAALAVSPQWSDARLGLLGPHGSVVASRRRRADRADRTRTERQWRCFSRRWHSGSHRRL